MPGEEVIPAEPQVVPAEPASESAAAPEPSQDQWDARKAYDELKGEIGNVNSMFRGVQSLQSNLARIEQALSRQGQGQNNQIPEVVRNLPPEQLRATEELVDHIFKQKYGSYLDKVDSLDSRFTVESVYSSAKSVLGNDEFTKLEPLMAEIVESVVEARDNGDKKAGAFLDFVVSQGKIGAQVLASLAERKYASSLQAKGKQAQEASVARGAAAAGSVPSAGKSNAVGDPSKLSIEKLRELAEAEMAAGAVTKR